LLGALTRWRYVNAPAQFRAERCSACQLFFIARESAVSRDFAIHNVIPMAHHSCVLREPNMIQINTWWQCVV
jgi:hypothetical protein